MRISDWSSDVCSSDLWNWWVLAIAWIVLGIAYAGLITPGGRLLRRSASSADLPLLFAAQFSLVHAGWMVAYPLAGWLRSEEHTSELQSLMRISYAVFCLKKKKKHDTILEINKST